MPHTPQHREERAVPFSSFFQNAPADFQAAVGLVDLLRPRIREQRRQAAQQGQQLTDAQLRQTQLSPDIQILQSGQISPFGFDPVTNQPTQNPAFQELMQRLGFGEQGVVTGEGAGEAFRQAMEEFSKSRGEEAPHPQSAQIAGETMKEGTKGTMEDIANLAGESNPIAAIARGAGRASLSVEQMMSNAMEALGSVPEAIPNVAREAEGFEPLQAPLNTFGQLMRMLGAASVDVPRAIQGPAQPSIAPPPEAPLSTQQDMLSPNRVDLPTIQDMIRQLLQLGGQ